MEAGLPIHAFVDEVLIDELWTLLKREGVPKERVNEISLKVGGKAKFGFGKLWSWLAADMSGEVEAGVGDKHEEHLQYTALFRSLFLRELLPSLQKVTADDHLDLRQLEQDGFVDILCEQVELIPLPTQAGFIRQLAIHSIGEMMEERAKSNDEFDADKVLAYMEKYTVSDRALNMVFRVVGREDESPGLRALMNSSKAVIENALSMSANDHVLIVGRMIGTRNAELLFCVVKEEGLRRNLAAYTGLRRLAVFGQIAAIDAENGHVGIVPVTISLG